MRAKTRRNAGFSDRHAILIGDSIGWRLVFKETKDRIEHPAKGIAPRPSVSVRPDVFRLESSQAWLPAQDVRHGDWGRNPKRVPRPATLLNHVATRFPECR